jgi:hypothetical protein
MDLCNGEVHLLIYYPGNDHTEYDRADKRILLCTLQEGVKCYPAISMQGCEGALELRTSTRPPSGCPDVLEQLQETTVLVQEYRATMAGMDARLEEQRAELERLRGSA